jgi:hypothetical protein
MITAHRLWCVLSVTACTRFQFVLFKAPLLFSQSLQNVRLFDKFMQRPPVKIGSIFDEIAQHTSSPVQLSWKRHDVEITPT